LFYEPELYFVIFVWLLLTLAAIYLLRVSLGKSKSMHQRLHNDPSRYGRMKAMSILGAVIFNTCAAVAILATAPGMLLWTKAQWAWTALDWFYTFTTIRLLTIFW